MCMAQNDRCLILTWLTNLLVDLQQHISINVCEHNTVYYEKAMSSFVNMFDLPTKAFYHKKSTNVYKCRMNVSIRYYLSFLSILSMIAAVLHHHINY